MTKCTKKFSKKNETRSTAKHALKFARKIVQNLNRKEEEYTTLLAPVFAKGNGNKSVLRRALKSKYNITSLTSDSTAKDAK